MYIMYVARAQRAVLSAFWVLVSTTTESLFRTSLETFVASEYHCPKIHIISNHLPKFNQLSIHTIAVYKTPLYSEFHSCISDYITLLISH